MSISGESDMYGENWRVRVAKATRQSAEISRDNSAAAIKRWRDGGGYEGALQRTGQAKHAPYQGTTPAVGHMPFPGHRHMGETG